MDFAALRAFLAVYDAGNVTAAARALHVSQPGVSAHLRRLEHEIGQSLFERRPRGVVPTPAGEAFAAEVRPLVRGLAQVTEQWLGASREVRRVVSVAGPEMLLAHCLMPALLGGIASGTRIHAAVQRSADAVDGVRSGRVDIAVLTGPVRGRQLRSQVLMQEQLIVVAAPQFVVDGDPWSAPVLAFDDDLPMLREAWAACRVAEPPAPTVVIDGLHALLALALDGVGVTALPEHVCARHLVDGTLVRINETAPVQDVWVCWHTRSEHDPTIAGLLDVLSA